MKEAINIQLVELRPRSRAGIKQYSPHLRKHLFQYTFHAKKSLGATTGYIRYITEYAYDTELDDAMFKKLLEFAALHLPIAKKNAERKAEQIINTMVVKEALGEGPGEGAERSPIQPGPGGTLEGFPEGGPEITQ